MEFSWTEEQLALKQSVIEFAQRELNQNVAAKDLECRFPAAEWQKCAEFGIQGLGIPEAYGGQGHDLLTTMFAMEGLGYGCRDNGLTFALNAEFVSTAAAILKVGNETQKQTYLRGICSGEMIGAYAMTEPTSGSDAFSLKTLARETEGGYLLTGHKILLTFGPVADFAIVFATVDPSLGHWGISSFLVDKSSPGFKVTETQPKMGLRTTPIGELILEDCFVPADNMLGEEGAGAAIFTISQEWERAMILSSQLGIMEYQLETAIAYAQERQQFGQSIGKFQAVSHRITEMKMRLDIAKMLAYRAAWLIDQGLPATTEASMANIYMSESFVANSLDAVMVHGGRGYLSSHEIERDLRDAVGGPVYGGTSDIQRNIIAKELGL
ncbi:MAG: acyl-CoA dehydrogenase family protein [Chloroflexota bacterium]